MRSSASSEAAPSAAGWDYSIRHLARIEQGAHLSWIRFGIGAALVGYLIPLLLGAATDLAMGSILREAGAVLLLALALFLAFRGPVSLGAFLAVAVVWAETHAAFYAAGELTPASVPVLPALVVGAGIFLGGRWALILAGVTSLTVPAAVLLGRLQSGPDPLPEDETPRTYTILAVVLVAVALLVARSLQSMGSFLEVARRNERRISDLLARYPDAIVALNAEGVVDAFNQAAERLLGVTAEQAVGRHLSELSPDLGIRLSPALPVEGFPLPPLPVEQTVKRPDGGELVVEIVRHPMISPEGKREQILVIRDLTERRTVEALATQLGRIVEEARSEIYVFHRDTLEILMINRGARENLGYSTEEIRGMEMFHIQPTLVPDVARSLTWKLFQEGEEVITLNTIHHRKDGSAYPLEIQLQKGGLDGEPVVLAFGTDVSDREKAREEQQLLQAQLQHAQKMEAVGLLAGGVAHDFNNLLTVISGCGEILMEVGDDQVRELTREILEAQDRGAVLTRQLLAFARRELVQAEDLPLLAVLRELTPLVKRVLGERIELVLEEGRDGVIRADRGQVEQVVLNLVTNARDAMPDGGRLEIGVDAGPSEGGDEGSEWVALTIRDTGAGIDPQVQERMFEPFFTTKPRGKGTGLGLSTVHGIVSQNQGRITVESRLGEGTTFRILWPTAQGDESPSEASARPAGGRPQATILLAEDEEGARDLIRAVLTREGYEVIAARDGREALALLQQGGALLHLLITDIVMPGLSGLELADRARELHPTLPVLFMSGYVDTSPHGPDGAPVGLRLLAKPFRPAELRNRVKELLSPLGP